MFESLSIGQLSNCVPAIDICHCHLKAYTLLNPRHDSGNVQHTSCIIIISGCLRPTQLRNGVLSIVLLVNHRQCLQQNLFAVTRPYKFLVYFLFPWSLADIPNKHIYFLLRLEHSALLVLSEIISLARSNSEHLVVLPIRSSSPCNLCYLWSLFYAALLLFLSASTSCFSDPNPLGCICLFRMFRTQNLSGSSGHVMHGTPILLQVWRTSFVHLSCLVSL